MDWQYMDDQMNAAIQNLNPNMVPDAAIQQPDYINPIPEARNIPNEPRRSDREPLYSEKYLQYRARLLEGDGTESLVETDLSDGTSSSDNQALPSKTPPPQDNQPAGIRSQTTKQI